MLVKLATLSEVPGAHGVVQSSGPQSVSVGRDVDAAGTVRVTLELPDQRLVVQIPHGDVAV